MNELEFPLWLRINHFVNFLFITFIIRSGIQILSRRPKFYWNDKCAPGTEWLSVSLLGQDSSTDAASNISKQDPGTIQNKSLFHRMAFSEQALTLANNWHYISVIFWCANGFIYLVLLICTNNLQRLLPNSVEVFPEAWRNLISYSTFHFPAALASGHYDALQQLSYAFVVFVMAPLSILSGAAISTSLGNKYPWYPNLFGGRQAARSIHFILLIGYLIFVAVHLSMVALTGFSENMNRIVFGVPKHDFSGILVGLSVMGAVFLLQLATIYWSNYQFERVMGITGFLPQKITEELFGADELSPENVSCPIAASPSSTEEIETDDYIREKIRRLLEVEQLSTQMFPFPETNKEFEAIVAQLRLPENQNLEQKLVISGFHHKPVNDQKCLECIYYQVHRRWCDLKELELPVEADWWCRLWRI